MWVGDVEVAVEISLRQQSKTWLKRTDSGSPRTTARRNGRVTPADWGLTGEPAPTDKDVAVRSRAGPRILP